jgi:hypothetical protein
MTFIDDHSTKTFLYILRNKCKVLDIFKEFHSKVEIKTSKKLKCVRSNNGGEYRGPFERYCRKFGIMMHAKYMHELCNLLMQIPTCYNVISCYDNVL